MRTKSHVPTPGARTVVAAASCPPTVPVPVSAEVSGISSFVSSVVAAPSAACAAGTAASAAASTASAITALVFVGSPPSAFRRPVPPAAQFPPAGIVP